MCTVCFALSVFVSMCLCVFVCLCFVNTIGSCGSGETDASKLTEVVNPVKNMLANLLKL